MAVEPMAKEMIEKGAQDSCWLLVGNGGIDSYGSTIWVVVKITVTFWIASIVRHLISRVPKKGP